MGTGREPWNLAGRNLAGRGLRAIGAIALVGAVASACSVAATTTPPAEPTAPPVAVTTAAPTTAEPTTDAPTTAAPTTEAPTTAVPTTEVPTTPAPTTTEPSPAIVPVAAADVAFQAVGKSDGDETARIQLRLLELGFWLAGVDGDYGLTTSQAVMAFQKYQGLEASGRVDQATADALSAATLRAHGMADAGTLVEIDKDKQLLFFVQDGVTVWVFNTSTGNGEQYTESDQNTPGETVTGVALTPNGLHAVNRERPEGWWEGDLGRIYRPKYFVGGVAVHGSNNVPNHPASHGCVRVTTVAMDFIWDSNLMPMGIPVWVHGAH